MKLQNPSLIFFEQTDGRTDARTSRNQYAPNFFKVGGIKKPFVQHHDDLKKLLVSQCYIPGAIHEQNCIICTPMQFKCFNM